MSANFVDEILAVPRMAVRDAWNALNPRDSFNNTNRRIKTALDELLISPEALKAEFEKIEADPTKRGDVTTLVKNVDEFDKKVFKSIKRSNDAHYGVLVHIHDIIAKIRKQKKEINNKIDKLNERGLSKDTCKKLKIDVEKYLGQTFDIIEHALLAIEKQEFLISRERDQLNAVMVKLESTMKSQLSFFFARVKSLDKEIAKDFSQLNKDIDPKDKNLEQNIIKELEHIQNLVKSEMELMFEEIRNLVHIILEIEKGLSKIIHEVIEKKLEGDMKLPEITGEVMIKKIKEIFDKERKTAEEDKQKAAKLIQEAESAKAA